MELTWLGHSSVLLEEGSTRVLADPVLRRRNGPLKSVPTPGVGDPRDWTTSAPDAVLLSHLHHDHCDLPTLRALDADVVIAPPGSGAWLRRRGVPRVVELAVGHRRAVGPDLMVTTVPAHHSGRRPPWGPTATAVGHLVETAGMTVWLAGDTALYPEMATIPGMGLRGRVDVAVVPVWGWGPRLGAGHLDPAAAAAAVFAVGARIAVPVHWGTMHAWGMSRATGQRLTMPGRWFLKDLRRHARAAPGGPVRGLVPRPGRQVRLV